MRPYILFVSGCFYIYSDHLKRILQQARFAHPYYWAAFIPAGDWTPLDQGTMRNPGPPLPALTSTSQPRPVRADH